MRHHTALQHGEGGPWHYVSVHPRRGGGPIGYCTEACTHETAAEAFAHYRDYVLDNLRPMRIAEGTQHHCEVPDCKTWTQEGLREPDGYGFHLLCDEHRNRETYVEHFYPEGQQRESWQS